MEPRDVRDNANTELLGTVGLLLNIAAVIASAICLNSVYTAATSQAGLSGAIAAGAFLLSLICFVTDRRRHDEKTTTSMPDSAAHVGAA
jgi:4-amino-4-deoxy-L-arabinose transferase-like glycosyltransferase